MWILMSAFAQGPLALPAAPDANVPLPPRPTSAASLPSYRQRAVSVRRYYTVEGGGASAVGWGWGWPGYGSPYGGMSTTYIIGNPTYEVERWAVYQGKQRLTVPAWMDIADSPDGRKDLRKRVRRTKTWHRILIGTAIVGGVAAVGSGWASQSAGSYEEFENWRIASSAGVTAVVGGVIGAYATGIHTRTLRYDFDATQEITETQELARRYNAVLRAELGLTQDQTADIDRGQP